jgi:signal transduction histidine kinase
MEFQQAAATTTRDYGGTDLGLALVKQLSQLLGGDVKVRSALGEGTVFVLTFRDHRH